MVANCKNCLKEFEYKWSGRGNSCSKECTIAIVAKSKIKYSDVQITKVVELKRLGRHNSEIVIESGVKLSKVKEIVKNNNLLLTEEEKQKRAYAGKLANDPASMAKMRGAYKNKTLSSDTLEEVKQIVLACGYEYVDGFIGKSKPFRIKCLKCYKIRETSKINTILKDACIYCSGSSRTSAVEIEIKDWVESLGLEVKKYKFKTRAGGIEIDVYVPGLKIGIEYCGLYWHNEDSPSPRDKTYHINKLGKANADGIRLITIFGDEWRDRKDQIKGFLLSVLVKNQNKVFGRKTEVKEIPRELASAFLEAYHIQGKAPHQVAFGLFCREELLGVITGNKHHRDGFKDTYVLNRLAFKNNYSVSGGSSKLFNALLNHAKKEGFKTLISWSDNRWSEGRVYEQMGFTLEENLGPDYSYVTGPNRLSKQSCQKKVLEAKGGVGSTETEMARSLGYSKIWDCGKKRWLINLI